MGYHKQNNLIADFTDPFTLLWHFVVIACPESPCGNKHCIPQHKICDGIPDCNDAADEDDCYGKLV